MTFKVAIVFVLIASSAIAQQARPSDKADETFIAESGYFVTETKYGFEVNVAAIIVNPYADKFASRPAMQVTIRAADGSIAKVKELSGAGIPPKSAVAICDSVTSPSKPASVTFRPMQAGYEDTSLRPSDFQPLKISFSNRRREGERMIITGEVTNPYARKIGGWVCLLFLDKDQKLLGGFKKWLSEIPPGDPFAFEMAINLGEVPPNLDSTDKAFFCDFNYQDSWLKVMGKQLK